MAYTHTPILLPNLACMLYYVRPHICFLISPPHIYVPSYHTHITPSHICNLSTSSTPLHPAPSQTPPHPVARCLSSSSSAPLLPPLLTPSLRALGPPRCPLPQEEVQLAHTYETHSMRYISPRGIYNASATHLNRGTPHQLLAIMPP